MRPPRVSAIIRTYQSEPTLLRAVASVLAQSFEDFELLIIDDGSVDGTEALIARVRDPRLRYVRMPVNLGRPVAMKVGVGLARGDFIGLLDADDWWYPRKLELQLEALERLPDVAFVSTNMALMHPADELLAVEGAPRVDDGLAFFPPMPRPGVRRLPHAPSLFRAAALRAVPIDIGLARCADLLLWQEIMLRSPCAVLTAPLYAYAYPQELGVYTFSAAATRRVYRRFFTRHPVASVYLQAMATAKQLAYRASAATGAFSGLKKRRGMAYLPAELSDFLAARAAVDRVAHEIVGSGPSPTASSDPAVANAPQGSRTEA
jgi:glycosyltransferase involved in cell wall biosynthesis